MGSRWIPTIHVGVCFSITLVAFLSSASSRAAESPTRVVILSEPSSEATRFRLTEELRALDIQVSEDSSHFGTKTDSVERAVRALSPDGLLRLQEATGEIEVWIVDQEGRPRLTETVRPASPAIADRRFAALRAVERLRASLIQYDVQPDAQSPKSRTGQPRPSANTASSGPSSDAPPPRGEEKPAVLMLSIGGMIVNSRGGVGTTGHGLAGLRFAFSESFGVDGFAALPVANASVQDVGGNASVYATLVGGGVWFAPKLDGVVRPTIEAGAIAAFMGTEGTGTEGYEGRADSNVVTLPYVGLGVGVRTAQSWTVRGDIIGGTAIRRTDVLFAGRKAASWGSLVVGGSLAVQVVLF